MVDKELADKFKKISTATITMQLLKEVSNQLMHGPKPLSQSQERIAGPAYIAFIPGREI